MGALKYPYFKLLLLCCHWLLVKCSLDCEEKVFGVALMWRTSTCLSPQLVESPCVLGKGEILAKGEL